MCNFHYVAMPMMISQILKSVNFKKTQKPRYRENKTVFLLPIKNSLITHHGLLYYKPQLPESNEVIFALKSDSRLAFTCFNKNNLKMMKNVFYSI